VNNLSVRERSAISSLRNSGTSVKSLAGAFNVGVGVIYSLTKKGYLGGFRSASAKPMPRTSLRPAPPAPSPITKRKRARSAPATPTL
jgi:transposase